MKTLWPDRDRLVNELNRFMPVRKLCLLFLHYSIIIPGFRSYKQADYKLLNTTK